MKLIGNNLKWKKNKKGEKLCQILTLKMQLAKKEKRLFMKDFKEKVESKYNQYTTLKVGIFSTEDYLPLSTVFDENESVRWNHEQVKKRNEEIAKEHKVKKQNLEKAYESLKACCSEYISEKTSLPLKVSKNLFDYLMEEENLVTSYDADLFLGSLNDFISCFTV